MTFTKRLREGIRRGEITCSVRIWTRPHVKVGARYRMEEAPSKSIQSNQSASPTSLHNSPAPQDS